MFNGETKEKFRVNEFPVASTLINQAMTALLDEIKDNTLLRQKLFQVDFLSTLSGELLISLLYHKQLDEQWLQAIKELKAKLSTQFKIDFIGRARKQKEVIGNDYVIERLNVNGKELIYQQVENSFTQPNAAVNCKMIEWALDCVKPLTGDLLEMYCGAGNFSLPLALHFDNVIGTEIAKPSVQAAQYNIDQNNLTNVKIVRLAAEEFTQAIEGKREFRRLKDAGVDLNSYNCNTIFVDPPRSGMDIDTCKMVQHYQRILYISCNPETLKENLEILSRSHSIARFALFDQFPYTHHMEAGILLERKA